MSNGQDQGWQDYKAPSGGEWQDYAATPPTPKVTKLEKDAKIYSSMLAKLGRGAALGAAEGAGIVPTTKKSLTGGVEAQSIKQFGKGVGRAAGAVTEDVGSLFVDPFVSKDKRSKSETGSKSGDVLLDMGRGLLSSGGESLKGAKERDPEAFAHGLGSLVTQLLMLKGGKESMGVSDVAGISERARLAKTAIAAGITGDEVANLERAMPEIVKQSQQAGIETVGDLYQNVKKAKRLADDTFNNGLASIANKPTVPMSISQRIRKLITPDMAKTIEGRAQIKYLTKRAVEYEKPWTYRELNAKRMTENENLQSFYKKDTQGQNAARLETDVSKAIRDSAADTVYQAWDQANPGKGAQDLKQRQGALWSLEDHLKGRIDDLKAKQLTHEGMDWQDKVKARVAVHRGGVGAYLTSPLETFFEKGPGEAANAKVRQAFPKGSKTPYKRVAAMALPIGALLGRSTPFTGPPPPPPSPEDEQ